MLVHMKILFFVFLIHFHRSNGNADKTPARSTASIVAESIASFGRKLITSMESESKPNENLLISPANIFHSVALLHMAARGNTLKEITNLMAVPAPVQKFSKFDFHSAMSRFYRNITTDDSRPVVLNMADALYLQEGFKIKKQFLDNAVKTYQAQIENINFTAGEDAVKKVNRWISQKTKDRISKVVESFLPLTQAVAISTLYFKANWVHMFKKEETRTQKFFTEKNEVDVQMMNLIKPLRYVNHTELQFESIDLPYSSSNYVLNVILPYRNQTVRNLIPKLKDISVNEIMEKGNQVGVHVKLPKTKFNVVKSLAETFQHLGVEDLFNEANLTELSDAKLKISQILHSAEIDIGEEGTVATAATVTNFGLKSGSPPRPNPLPFHVDRPFIVNIYDKTTALNLFSGIVRSPETSS